MKLNQRRFIAWLALCQALVLGLSSQTELNYQSFSSDGIRIAYLEQGEGDPVILLHGAFGNSEINWVGPGIFTALANEHHVIAMDLRGHGKSDKPHLPAAYGRKMVEDVLRLMDHLKIPRAHVLGYSLGSQIVLKLVADHRDRLLSAVMGGPGWNKPGDDLSGYLNTARSLEEGHGLGPLLKSESAVPEGETPPSDEEISKITAAFAQFNDFKAVAACLRGIGEFSVSEKQLQGQMIPCLFLYGTKDPARKQMPEFEIALSNYATFSMIEGAGHGNAFVKPQFLPAVQKFLREKSGGKAGICEVQ